MSGFFFTIFVLIVFFNILKNFSKTQTKSNPKSYVPKTRDQSNYGSDSSSQNAEIFKDRARQAGRQMARQEAARKAKQKFQERVSSGNKERLDPADKNRHRTAGWGQRAGPGLWTMSNITILLLLGGLVLYILSKIPM